MLFVIDGRSQRPMSTGFAPACLPDDGLPDDFAPFASLGAYSAATRACTRDESAQPPPSPSAGTFRFANEREGGW